jgi:hypothetical protein
MQYVFLRSGVTFECTQVTRTSAFLAATTLAVVSRPGPARWSESTGVVLTIEALPRLLIFGDTAEQALRWARDAIGFYLRETSHVERPVVELVRRESTGRLASVLAEPRQAAA